MQEGSNVSYILPFIHPGPLFETKSLQLWLSKSYKDQADLMALNSRRSTCLCLLSTRLQTTF